MDRRALSRKALRAAIRQRRDAGIGPDQPLSIIDFADRPGELEVWFVNEPRLEGLYEHGNPSRILISSHRTPGRQALTCAHEFGHHAFGHGTRWDLYVECKSDSSSSCLTSSTLVWTYSLGPQPLERTRNRSHESCDGHPEALPVGYNPCRIGMANKRAKHG